MLEQFLEMTTIIKIQKFSTEFLIVLGIAITTILLQIRNGWIETDSYAFYNYFCLQGKSFEIPIISNYIFSILPCEQYLWYGFQAVIWLLCFNAIVGANKIFYKIEEWKIAIIGLSISFIYGVLAIEDDFLAFPLIVYGALAVYNGNKKQKILGIICLLLATLFWKGAILISSIILLGAITPILGFIPVIAYILSNGLNSWGGSTEAILGIGIVSLVPFLIILFFSNKNSIKIFRESKNFLLSIPFILLTLYQVKFGLYTILFLPIWFQKLITDEEFSKKIALMAGIVFVILIIGISLTKPPNQKHFDIVKQGVEIQKSGENVLTAWWVGRWFEYFGGVSSQAGGYGGPQDANGSYWLGDEIKECFTLAHEDDLFLQKC